MYRCVLLLAGMLYWGTSAAQLFPGMGPEEMRRFVLDNKVFQIDSRKVIVKANKPGYLESDVAIDYTISSDLQAVAKKKFEFHTDPQLTKLLDIDAYVITKEGARTIIPEGDIGTYRSRDGVWNYFVESDEHAVIFRQLEVGAKVHIHYRVEQRTELWPGQIFGTISPYEDSGFSVPIRHFEAEFLVPESASLEWQVWDKLKRSEQSIDGVRTVRFSAENLPAIPNGNSENPASLPVIMLSSMRDMAAVAQGYLAAQPHIGREERVRLKALVASVVIGARSDDEKLGQIYRWLAKHVRYMSVTLGTSGWISHSVTETLDTNVGDCKAQATLLVALLHEAGIKAELALVNIGQRVAKPLLATPTAFNHMIVYLPTLNRFVDATASQIVSSEDMPDVLQGKPAYLLQSERWAYVPISPLEKQTSEEKLMIQYSPTDRTATFVANARYSGRYAEGWRGRQLTIEGLTADGSESAIKLLQKPTMTPISLDGLKVNISSLEQSEQEGADGSLNVVVKGSANAVDLMATRDYISLHQLFSNSCLQVSDLQTPYMKSQPVYRQKASCVAVLELRLPEGFEFNEGPRNVNSLLPDTQYHSTVKWEGKNAVSIRREWIADPARLLWQASEAQDYRDILRLISLSLADTLTFKKSAVESTSRTNP